MRKIILIIFLMCFLNPAFAEKLPTEESGLKFNEENNPIAYKYVKDFTDNLYDKLNTKQFPLSRWWLADNIFYIKKDGTVGEMRHILHDGKKYKQYTEKLIRENLPGPFPEGLDEEEIKFHIGLSVVPYKPKHEYCPPPRVLENGLRMHESSYAKDIIYPPSLEQMSIYIYKYRGLK